MKNFKIAMILVAAIAFLSSCGGDPEPPTMAFVDSTSQNEMTFDLANPTADVVAVCQIEDEKGISTLTVTRTMYDADNKEVGTVVPYTFEEPYEGKTEYTVTIAETLSKNEGEGLVKVEANVVKVVYEAVATNKKGGEGKATYTVNIKPASFTEANFTWERQGGNGTGLDEFGLEWKANLKSPFAIIKPVTGAKLYILAASDYAATSLSAITLPAEAEKYNNVDCNAAADYNDVIATVYNNKTFVINVKRCDIPNGGGKQTITGTYKAFEGTPASSK